MESLYIKKIELNNFKGIDSLSFNFDKRVNVLIGENGVGKSSILFGLAMALSRFIGRMKSLNSNGILFDKDYIKNDAQESRIKTEMFYKSEEIEWEIGKQRFQTKQTITNLKRINEIVLKVNEELQKNRNYSLPVVVFYGVGRNVVDVPLKIRTKHQFDQLAAYDEALLRERSVNDFRLFFEWFRNREDIENEKIRDYSLRGSNDNYQPSFFDEPIYLDPQLNAVRSAIHSILPGFENLRVKRNPLRMVLTKRVKGAKAELKVDQLSDGEKCTLSMVGDLARRLSIANPDSKDPLKGEGVVLIDELDLHLHPGWEVTILQRLIDTFPNCQFIVSTHSPLILSSLNPNNIFMLSIGDSLNVVSKHPDLAKGLSVKDILSSLMSVDKERDEETAFSLKQIDSYLIEEDIESAKKQMGILKKHLDGKEIPEMKGLNAAIQMLEFEDKKQ